MTTSRERQDALKGGFEPNFGKRRGKDIFKLDLLNELGMDLYIASTGKDLNDEAGGNYIRFVPYKEIVKPFWQYVPVHYNVGVENDRFICRKGMWRENCPICEDQRKLLDEGLDWDDPKLDSYKWSTRVLLWVIDAYNKESEEEGVKLYVAPQSIIKKGALPLMKDPRMPDAVLDPSDVDENMVFYFHCYKEEGDRFPDYSGYRLLFTEDDLRPLTDKELKIPEFEDVLCHPTYEEVRESLMGFSSDVIDEQERLGNRPGDRREDYHKDHVDPPVEDEPASDDKPESAERSPRRRASSRAEEIKGRESESGGRSSRTRTERRPSRR